MEQEESSGLPWGKMALMALLAGGGAYAHGRFAQNSPLQGFSQGLDNNYINPLVAKFKGLTSSPMDEYKAMHSRVNQAGILGQFSGLKNMSQLHGTEFHTPDKAEQFAGNVAGGAGVGLLGQLGGQVGGWGFNKVAPQAAARFGSTAVGSGLGAAGRFLGKASPFLGAATTLQDSMQLGDKFNDSMGIQNNLARNTVKGGTMAAGAGGVFGGARAGAMLGGRFGVIGAGVGGLLGGAVGAMAPMVANSTWNYKNQGTLMKNFASSKANAMANEFSGAMQQKNFGNENPLRAWYGMQDGPEAFKMTLKQMTDPAMKRQMILNNPNRPL